MQDSSIELEDTVGKEDNLNGFNWRNISAICFTKLEKLFENLEEFKYF